jgi:hypothetical protein
MFGREKAQMEQCYHTTRNIAAPIASISNGLVRPVAIFKRHDRSADSAALDWEKKAVCWQQATTILRDCKCDEPSSWSSLLGARPSRN